MSKSVVEYSSSEQSIINISVFYIWVIIYTVLLCYLIMSNFRLKKKLDKLGDSIEDLNFNLHEEIKDKFGNFLQNKLVEVNDELLEEIDEVNCKLIKKINKERKLRIDQNVKSSSTSESLQKKIDGIEFRNAENLIHLKKEIARLSDNLLSKVMFDDALSLYQESPQLCEGHHLLLLLKNWDRRERPRTFEGITAKIMDNFDCMTVRRDSNISDLIGFLIDNKIRTGTHFHGRYAGEYVPFDFSKGLDEVKNEIFRTYRSFSDLDKEWLNVNVFGNNKKLF